MSRIDDQLAVGRCQVHTVCVDELRLATRAHEHRAAVSQCGGESGAANLQGKDGESGGVDKGE